MIAELQQKRIELQAAQKQISNLQLELEQTEAWQTLEQAKAYQDVLKKEVLEQEDKIREAALVEYRLTDNKKPFHGVSIIIKKALTYRPDRAIRWAIANNAMNMVTLKKQPFEKHARAVSDSVPLEFVEIKEEPAVRIAKEL